MSIITDPDLIQYRLALQEMLYKGTGDLALMAQELKEKRQKVGKLSKNDLILLENKLQEICLMFYELEFGNYFINKSPEFRKQVIQSLVKIYFDKVFDDSIEDLFHDSYVNIYAEMEIALQNQIKAEKNGR